MTYDKNQPEFRSKVAVSESGKRVYEVHPVVPEALANELVSYELTVDSVVATATIEYDDSHRSVTIFWGDSNTGEKFNVLEIRNRMVANGGLQLPENTIRVQHVYDVPEPPNRGSNLLVVTVLEDNDGRRSFGPTQWLRMVPRYKFILYPVILEFNSHLDSSVEQVTEISIDMTATHDDNTILDRHWEPNVVTNPDIGPPPGEDLFPIYYKLTGSALSHEIPLDSEHGVLIIFAAKERENVAKDIWGFLVDTFTAEFDTSVPVPENGRPRGFHPLNYTGSYSLKRYLKVQDGYFEAILNTEMNLIVPLDQTTNVVAHP